MNHVHIALVTGEHRRGYRAARRAGDADREQQRAFAAWKACVDTRIAQLWPGHTCASIGIVDVHLAWRWLERQAPVEVAAFIVHENKPA